MKPGGASALTHSSQIVIPEIEIILQGAEIENIEIEIELCYTLSIYPPLLSRQSSGQTYLLPMQCKLCTFFFHNDIQHICLMFIYIPSPIYTVSLSRLYQVSTYVIIYKIVLK